MTSATDTQLQFGGPAPAGAGRRSLSVCCMTAGPAARVGAILSLVREVADEIVVALDDRAGEDVRDAVSAVADRMLLYPYAEPVDRPIPWLHTQCSCDWVFNLDDDEVPSTGLISALPDLVQARDLTHYWIPRRWLFPDTACYLAEPPWLPDYQLRLVRNDECLLRFSADLHRPLAVLGPARFLESPVWHLDCVVRPLEARREKARKYERMRPGLRIGGRALNAAYFVPEDRRGANLAPVPAGDRATIDSVLAADPPERAAQAAQVIRTSRDDIDRLWPGRPLGNAAYRAELEFLHRAATFATGEQRTLDVRVTNRGDAVWSWGSEGEPAVRLASWWRGSPEAEAAAALRTPFPADVAPGTDVVVPVHVVAPDRPGRFRLVIDLVHERCRWFDCELVTDVDVVARRRIAIVGGDEAAEPVLRLLELEPSLEPVLVSRDAELPWAAPGHARVPGVRSYLFGGDPDRPGSFRLGLALARRSATLVRAARSRRFDGLPSTAAAFVEALVGCRLLVIAGADAPLGAPPPRELARLGAIVRVARALGVPIAVHRNALPNSPRRLVRLLRRVVLRRAALVYDQEDQLAGALARLGDSADS